MADVLIDVTGLYMNNTFNNGFYICKLEHIQ